MPDTYLQAVAEVARLAGDFARERYGRDLQVHVKGDGSPVTEADRGAEQVAREWIERHFPADGILGEEMGLTGDRNGRRWIVDPIDGTKSFIRRVPLWGTLVAVAEGETVLAGCAYFPVVDELIAAERGAGAWWNDSRCRVSEVGNLADATVLVTDARFQVHPERLERWAALAGRAAVARTWGDCYGYLLVATGRAEVMVDDVMSLWDAAALQPIVTEAGGVVTDWRGRATAFGGDLVATNGALAAEVREVLGAVTSPPSAAPPPDARAARRS